MKPCTMKGARDRSYDVKIFNNQVNAVDGAPMKGYKNKWRTTAWTIPTRIDSMVHVTLFSFHFIEPGGKLRIMLSVLSL